MPTSTKRKISGKVLPSSIESEQAVLSCILLDEGAVQANIFKDIKTEDFYSPQHKVIFDAMMDLYKENKSIDFITLHTRLEEKESLEKAGGSGYVTETSSFVLSAANYKEYVNSVKKNSVLRSLIKMSESIIQYSYESPTKQQALDFAEEALHHISKEERSSDLEHIQKITDKYLEGIEEAKRNPDSLRGIKTDFFELDKLTNGLHKSDLVLIAARPAVGKTSFAMNIVVNAALNSKSKVAIFSLEMPKVQLVQRAICSISNVDIAKLKKPSFADETDELTKVHTAAQKLKKSNIYVDDSSLNTPMQILSKCRTLQNTKGLDLVMVDYLQLMTLAEKKTDNRQQEVSEMSRMLKVAARELDVPILVLSQLSRAVETRKGRPVLSDLRESGAIEQDADIVMFLHNPNKGDEEQEEETRTNRIELILAKHRNGPIGRADLIFDNKTTTFRDKNKSSIEKSYFKNMPTDEPVDLTDDGLDEIFDDVDDSE